MAVSFIRSRGSRSHRGAVWKQQHARPKRAEKVPLRIGTICTWLLSTERGFTAPAKWKSHSTYRQLCQAKSGLSDLTVIRVLAFETILISPLVQVRQTWRATQQYFGKVVLIIRSCFFFLFAIRFSASLIPFFLWHLWVNCCYILVCMARGGRY